MFRPYQFDSLLLGLPITKVTWVAGKKITFRIVLALQEQLNQEVQPKSMVKFKVCVVKELSL